METQLFDVNAYLIDEGFKESSEKFAKEYSLFEASDGGLFVDKEAGKFKQSRVFYEDDSPRDDFGGKKYDFKDELGCLDIKSLDHEVSEYELSQAEMQWLNKSEDEIRNRIFELAEEIQKESRMFNQLKEERQSMSSSRASESELATKLSPSRNALTSDSVSEFDRVDEFDLKWCSTPINGPRPGSASDNTSSAQSSRMAENSRMPYFSLDGRGNYDERVEAPRIDKLREFRCRGSASDEGLVDWRIAAQSAKHHQLDERNNGISGPLFWDPNQKAKRRLCRHFLKGFCNRGDTCDFLHDNSIFCPDEQKVFLGGLPAHITVESLCSLLKEMNYTVINKPKILRGFTPQVCLSTIAEAQELIQKKKIYLDNTPVDVRPYEDRKPPDDLKRSVFLGGLSADTTVEDIREDLARAGYPVENNPILKAGFVPQVVLESVEKAQELIKIAKIKINNKFADVRPYVNFRKRY